MSASRIEQGRLRARHTKQALGVVAAAAFAAALILARQSHPGGTTSAGVAGSRSQASTPAVSRPQDDDELDFGDGSIQPYDGGGSSSVAPQVQSGAS